MGLSPLVDTGFRHVLIHPRSGGGLTWARASYRSIRGLIISAWRIDADNTFTLDVTIPPGTTATVALPAGDPQSLVESGKPLKEAAGVRVLPPRETASCWKSAREATNSRLTCGGRLGNLCVGRVALFRAWRHTAMREEFRAKPAAAGAAVASGRFSPLDPFPAAAAYFTPQRVAQLAWAFLVLGVVVRLIRYLLCFPFRCDESYLACNYLDRGYSDLLKPLCFIQVAPLLYLWVQKTLVLVLGFSEYSLRLYSLLCGIGSLFLFRHLAGRLLQGVAFLLAVGVFASATRWSATRPRPSPIAPTCWVSLRSITLLVDGSQRAGAAVVVGLDRSHAPGRAAFLPGGLRGQRDQPRLAGEFTETAPWPRWLRWGAPTTLRRAGRDAR